MVRDLAGDHGGRRRVAFAPTAGEQLAPGGERARVDANLAALRLLRDLERHGGEPTVEEQRTLAAWSAWGAVPGVFDEDRDEWAQARSELLELVGEDGYAAARRTTINAHYTDPAIVAVIWQTVRDLGFDGGRVLEPGCGIGTFIGLAAADAELTGVELDPATARLAQALYPHASVRNESFADTRLPDGHFDLTVGNVPFADVRLHDPQHNPGRHSIHNHFILKSLVLTRPGGLVAVLTSRFTLDAANPAARREMSPARRSRWRDPPAERIAPPHRRHRGGHGPADPSPPHRRRAASRSRAGRARARSTSTASRSGSTPGCRSGPR